MRCSEEDRGRGQRVEEFIRFRLTGLEARGIAEARLNLEHLLARRLGIPRLELRLCGAKELSEADARALDGQVARLAGGEPLQYVLGDAPFHGITVQCDRRALIPRPETEWLVEQVLACGAIWRMARPTIADAGTGTGCIALALAAARPEARLVAVDCDEGALALAGENRDRLGLGGRVELRKGDWLEGFEADAFDAVVSNPPYIPSAVCGTLDRHVREFEPRLALDGGTDGLAAIRRLVPQAWGCLKPGGSLWLEIGNDQGPAVAALLREAGFSRVAVRRDLAGHDRVACGWRCSVQWV